MKGNEKMEEKKKNQRERVLDYLNKGGILTDYNGTSTIRTYYIEGD